MSASAFCRGSPGSAMSARDWRRPDWLEFPGWLQDPPRDGPPPSL
jgi:hypothetical protein